MTWDRIIGQPRAIRALRTAIATGRMPHAWLFSGQEGVGKDAAAIEVARVLRCSSPGPDAEACGLCHGCTTTGELQNANVRFVFALPAGKGEDARGDAPLLKLSDTEISQIQEQIAAKARDPYFNISIPRAQQIKISSIREVKRDFSLVSTEPGWRVVIISEAHQMGEEAANAFLKTLEEPSPRTMLILTTSQRTRMLPTILSRCQEIRFDLLTDEQIADALRERNGADGPSAALLARLAGGSYSRAVELLNGDLNQLRHDVVTFLRAALKRSPLAIHAEIERLTSGGDRLRIEQTLALLALWLRDVLAMRLGGEDAVVNRDQLKDLASFESRFSAAPIDRMVRDVEETIRAVRSNAQIPLAFAVLSFRLADACFTV